MAKVSLRIYNREIESLIDQGSTNEVIAHCQHILKTFPKHLATYRLLGKAYLESKRYPEAVDIFGRVLMSVPDDFVAHVGMSIIRDEENKLDDAIWHMQRAFESQASNPAIQGELQRLYGRRDGMEPPKIRMTRGALAHMYMQGELYPQAVAEIRAVLAQEPDRADMQMLLARAYFRGGQKADASDMCAQLLKRYLYCFDANRIMVDLLPATAGAIESTQVYRMRVGELDPYATFAKGSVFQSDEVADAAINLDRLEYKEEEPQVGQAWGAASLGSGASSAPMLASGSSSEQPDWLKSGGFSDSQLDSLTSSQAVPTTSSLSASQPDDGIPDFLRSAGWGESNNPEQPTSFFDAEPASGDLTPADIPDWLKGQVPSNIAQPDKPQPASAQSIETPDWLSGLGGTQEIESFDSAQPSSAKMADTPDWLSGLGNSQSSEATPAQSGNGPDSLTGFGSSQSSKPEPAQPGNVPDWLSGLDDTQSSEPVPAQPSDTPDWLTGLGDSQTSEPIQAGNVPDWLAGLGDDQPEPVQAGNVPDWLAGLDDSKTSELAQPGNDSDWLTGLGDLQTSEPIQAGNVPDWLAGLGDVQPEPAQPADIPDWMRAAEPASQASAPTVESLGSTAQEQDDAVAWLESLAAKHGAKPEELVTDPNKRSETPPEWVSQAQNIEQQTPAPQASAPTVESLGSTAQEQDDAVAWLESLAAKHGAKPEELVTDPNKRSETPPEWVSQAQNIEQQTPAPQASAPTVESLGSTAQEQDDAVAWLESLAAKHGAKPEELVTDPNKRSETPPEWVSQAQNIEQQTPAPQASAPTVESLGSTAQEQDDAVAWLESLAAKHGAKPEELVTDPNKRSETPPEWVSQAQNIEQQTPAPQASAPTVESLGSTAQEQDDAVAWLESLAAKHGAKPEELVTDPNKRSETPPEWVSQAQNIEQQTPAPQASAPTVESLGSTAQEQDDAVAWLESLAAKHGAKPEELVTDPNKRFDKPPEWVSQAQSIGEAQSASAAEEEKSNLPSEIVENALNIGEQYFAEFENASTATAPASIDNDETGMWLRDLEEKEKQDEFAAKTTNDVSDWLGDSQSQSEKTEEQNLSRSDIPEWLSDSQRPQNAGGQFDFIEEDSIAKDTFVNQNLPQDDLSNWLSGLDDEPGLPFDGISTPDSILIAATLPKSTKEPIGQEPVESKSDLPDWLNNVDSQGEAAEDDWQKPVAQDPVIPVSKWTEESFDQTDIVPTSVPEDKPESVKLTENLPDWLQSMDEEEITKDDVDASPWLSQEALEAKEPQEPKPTSPSDWHPVESKQQPVPVSVEKKVIPPVDARKSFAPQPVPPAEPFAHAQPLAERPVETRTPAKKKSGLPAKQRQPAEGQGVTVALNQAKGELDRGDIPTALDHYKKLIKKGRHLEETIRDLTESIYRYPVEVGIWQTLGDAYMRANRLKEALEAYNKAEELIR